MVRRCHAYRKLGIGNNRSLRRQPFEDLEARDYLAGDLIVTGVIDGPLAGGTPKAIELYARADIPNLSRYAIGSANNGGGSDGIEFTFPPDAVAAGTFLYVASESPNFNSFFGFDPQYVGGSAVVVNGDDAVEFFFDGNGDGFVDPLAADDVVSDVFGDINTDGTGQSWEYLDGWAYRVHNTGPDSSNFTTGNWTFSGINALDGEVTNATSTTPFPSKSYSVAAGPEIDVLGGSPPIAIASGDNSPSIVDGTDFGSAETGADGITRTFTIANTGSLDLDLTGTPLVSITGSADFSIRSQPSANSVSAGSSTSFDLTFSPLAAGTQTASVSITSNDADEDPFTFAIQGTGVTIATNVGINEVDADTVDENNEFIELYDGGVGNTPLDGLVVVLFNGSDNLSNNAVDLDGLATGSDGFFVIGDGDTLNVDFTPVGFDAADTTSPGSDLQNGEDAVALYVGDATDFPNDTPATATNRIDAVVYETGADANSTLPTDLGTNLVIDENANGSKDVESISRSPDGTGAFVALAPTPGATNTVVPLPEMSIDDVSVDESAGKATFNVKLSHESANSVTVLVESVNATATAPSDYSAVLTMPILFAPGQTEKAIDVSIIDDGDIEGNETFVIRLFNANGATIVDGEGLGTIIDNEPLPSLSITDVVVDESDGNANFIVTLSPAVEFEVSVSIATADGSAMSTLDFTAVELITLTFAAGETTKAISVPIVDDAMAEADETFSVELSNPVGATIEGHEGVATILANDLFSFSPGDVVINEIMQNPAAVTDGDGEFFELWNTTSSAIDISGWTIKDEASASENHTIGNAGPLSIPAGGFLVLGVNGGLTTNGGVGLDYVYDSIVLGNGADGLILTDASGTVIDQVIWDDGATFPDPNGASMELIPGTSDPGTQNDLGANWQASSNALPSGDTATPGAANSAPIPPEVSINDVTVEESAGAAEFTVKLSKAATVDITVDVTTIDGTAIAPGDYESNTATLTFPAGQTSQTFSVTIGDDLELESPETFNVNLSNSRGATIVDDQGIGTIIDNDVPSVSIDDVMVEESAGTATFNVMLSASVGFEVSVTVATSDETATAPSDYLAIPPTVLTFAAGQNSKTVEVPIIDDATTEANETFTVNLSNPEAATIDDNQAVGTILANDVQTFNVGDVVINEVMQNPAAVSDGDGEFFELWNTTSSAIDINGWTIKDDASASERHTISHGGPLSIPAGGFLVLGLNRDTTTNGGIPVDYAYSAVVLGNGTDGLIIEDMSGTVIDQVIWDDGATFPDPNGASMELIPSTSSPGTANNLGNNWQVSLNVLPSGDHATPRAVNSLPLPPEVSIDDVTINESDGIARFTVSLSKEATTLVSVDVWTADDTALVNEDYTGILEVLTFSAGETSKTFRVSIIDDDELELTETFYANLSNPSGATIADDQGIGTIIDDEVPGVSIDDVTVDESAGTATFTVTLSAAVDFEASVRVATVDASASSPNDFTAIPPTTLTFAAGETSQKIAVLIIDDATPEANENFRVELSHPLGATLTDDHGEATILANDAPLSNVGDVVINEIMQNPAAVSDGEGEFIELWNTTSNAIDINGWTIMDDASASESHTIDAGGPLWIPAGGFLVLGINGDTTTNGAIDVDYVYSLVTLGNGVDGVILADVSGNVIDQVIWDDGLTFPDPNGGSMELIPGMPNPGAANDLGSNWQTSSNILSSGDKATPGAVNSTPSTAEISIDDVIVTESAGIATFTVTLSEPASSEVTVTVATSDGTAKAGDYAALSTTLTFNPGETLKTVRFWIIDDTITEGDETFSVGLSNPIGATIVDDQGLGTILDNDAQSFEAGDVVINEIMQNPAAVSDGAGEFIEFWNTTSNAIDLNGWTIKDDTTASESHTISNGGSLTIPAGGFLVLGVNADAATNGGIHIDYVYSGLTLGNGADGLLLAASSGNVIDQVIWDDGATFPDPNGASMELIPGTLNPGTANDLGSNWQASSHTLPSGDHATPGAANSRPIEEDDCTPISGDINGDGVIDFEDFLLMSSNFGNRVSAAEIGDLNCDGVVDFADFLILSVNFGQMAPPTADAVDQFFASFV